MMLLLLTSLLALLSPKAAEQTLLSSKPTVKISVQVVMPPPTGIGLAWDFPTNTIIQSSTLYWGRHSRSYEWQTNVPFPASTVWITPTNQQLFLVVTCTATNQVMGTVSESPPSPEITTFLPSINLTNPPSLNFASTIKYRLETATATAGPWTGFPNTNWNPATGNQFFRINFSW